jgi:transposase
VQLYVEARSAHRSDWSAIESVAAKIGCTPQSSHRWIGLSKDKNSAKPSGVGADERVIELEREVRELKRANEILKLASAFFAQAELDRRLK